ncbi:MAG: hypothetical protein EU547_02540 [Promethearchaeota archaeon]|nr:MAG: hypothetical protein EU547_02540 [Candidatus Lokiarchaeota archaeon]
MSSHEIKLRKAKLILEEYFGDSIENLLFQPKLSRIKIQLRNDNILFIQYNDYNEYSYSIIFSEIQLDRCRFDNYDNRWDVPTRPHHFHPRYKKEAIRSNMNGEPDNDIPYFCELIKTGKIINLSG